MSITLASQLPDHLPPQSLEYEQATLGAALISASAAKWVRDELFPECFYLEAHRRIFNAIVYLAERGEPVDSLSISEELRSRGQLDQIGGMAYINALWESVPTAAHVEFYGKSVLELAVTRSLASRCQKIIAAVHERELPLEELLSWAEGQILGIDQRAKSQPDISGPVALAHSIAGNILGEEDEIPMLPTGWPRLDRIVRGLPQGLMSIIAGRPGNGKTTLALSWAIKMVKEKIPTLIFSTETPKSQVMRRVTAIETGIAAGRLWPNPDEYRKGAPQPLDLDEVSQVAGVADLIRELPLYVDDEAELTVSQIRSRIRRAKQKYGIRQVFIDQLQTIMRNPGENDNSSLTNEVIYPLQRLARAEGVSLTLLCQLSRLSERRAKSERRPVLSDLRDCLPGDAQVIDAATGRRIPVSEIVSHGLRPEVWSLSRDLKMRKRQVVDAWETGEKPILKVTSGSGRVLRASGGHRVYALDGWKKIEELKPGGYLARAEPHPAVDIVWDEVRSIVPDGVEPTYDLTVSEDHNLVVDDFYVHNSGSLEQAARMVFMVHRPNYYEDSPDQKTADLEVLVRKNNEGATGALACHWDMTNYRLSEIDHIHEDEDAPPGGGHYG